MMPSLKGPGRERRGSSQRATKHALSKMGGVLQVAGGAVASVGWFAMVFGSDGFASNVAAFFGTIALAVGELLDRRAKP